MKRKLSVILLGIFACSISTFAQDIITFTWRAIASKSFYIQATIGETFTVDWGDSSDIETYTGTGQFQHLSHTYNAANDYTVTITANTEECELLSFESPYNLLSSLDVSNCKNLVALRCNTNQLTNLDVSGCTKLKYLYCFDNKLTSLDVSNNNALINFMCFSNQLSNLDLSNLTMLTFLNFGDNQITSIDISTCKELEYLYCNANQLTSLDVTNNKELKYLRCNNNQLESLDLSSSSAIIELFCYDNRLTNLDISNCKRLEYLYCHDNYLANLDISNCVILKELYCSRNQLTSLNASGCTRLAYLSCSNNQLSILDVRGCRNLEYLYAYNNQLTNLDVSSCTRLKDLWIYNNRLPLSDLYAASEMINVLDAKLLGTQTMLPQRVGRGKALFSDQSVFNGMFTNYTVAKNGNPAPESDYTVTDGKITFNALGIYTVTMTNAAIASNSYYPAEVTVDLMVVDEVGIAENVLSNISVYPNPTMGELRIEVADQVRNDGELRINSIEIFDVYGRKVSSHHLIASSSHHLINISHLPQGVYIVNIIANEATFTHKIVKKNNYK
ncbi:MAG: leucine-rich repeat domain-containing protein [Lentimicrobiaceae bacterium]|nr:leucine-rich repeat domain-containing protein [Lentimicrobiaceae bacterium]